MREKSIHGLDFQCSTIELSFSNEQCLPFKPAQDKSLQQSSFETRRVQKTNSHYGVCASGHPLCGSKNRVANLASQGAELEQCCVYVTVMRTANESRTSVVMRQWHCERVKACVQYMETLCRSVMAIVAWQTGHEDSFCDGTSLGYSFNALQISHLIAHATRPALLTQ